MRRILTITAAGLALGAVNLGGLGVPGASAADLPRKSAPPPYPALVPVAFDWSGFYVGAFFGGSAQDVTFRQFGGPSVNADSGIGFAGGLLTGRNFQFGRVVVGYEGDITVQEVKTRVNRAGLTPLQTDFIWNGSIRGRLGYAFDRFLPFVTAGYTEADHNIHAGAGSGLPFNVGDVRRHTGYTVGAGLDYAVTDNLVARVEYNYADYERRGYFIGGVPVSASFDSHIVRGAIIFKESSGTGPGLFGGLIPPLAFPSFQTAAKWAGVYGGAVAGYAGGDARFTGAGVTARRDDLSGYSVGTIIGANYAFAGGLVVGAEGDLSRATTEGKEFVGGLGRVDFQQYWNAHVRARLGYAFGAVMPFVAGGFAITQGETRLLGTGLTEVSPFKGWTIGGGLEAKVSDRLALRAEYLHDSYPADRFQRFGQPYRAELTNDTARVGLTYQLTGLGLGF